MGLNKSKGNMYEFITHTWNVIKGQCYHDCSYCYMKRWGKLNPVRFDEKELKTDLGTGNFIFVGSSCDMFAPDIPEQWIQAILSKCEHSDNRFFFQSKNTFRYEHIMSSDQFLRKCEFCTTVESNIFYDKFMGKTLHPHDRIYYLPGNSYITIEPIMDFDLSEFVGLLSSANPKQINIGADSGNNGLPEPSKEKILELIDALNEFTKVELKKNINRLIK